MTGEKVVVVITKFNRLLRVEEQVPIAECTIERFTRTTVWVKGSIGNPSMPYSLTDGVCCWKQSHKIGRASFARIREYLSNAVTSEQPQRSATKEDSAISAHN